MKSKTLLRIAMACLLFFAFGHTIGHITRHDTSDPKEKQVLAEMAKNKFNMFGQMRSPDENYTGMSLNLIFTLLALAFLLLFISSYADNYPGFSYRLLWPVLLCTLGFAITSWLYFFPVPAFSSFAASIFVVLAMIALRRKMQSSGEV